VQLALLPQRDGKLKEAPSARDGRCSAPHPWLRRRPLGIPLRAQERVRRRVPLADKRRAVKVDLAHRLESVIKDPVGVLLASEVAGRVRLLGDGWRAVHPREQVLRGAKHVDPHVPLSTSDAESFERPHHVLDGGEHVDERGAGPGVGEEAAGARDRAACEEKPVSLCHMSNALG